MTQKRMQLVTCVSLLMLTAVFYLFRLFSATRTGVEGTGALDQFFFLLAPVLVMGLFFLGAHGWHSFAEESKDEMTTVERTKGVLLEIGVLMASLTLVGFIFQFDVSCQCVSLMGLTIPLQWLVGLALMLIVPMCLEDVFQCWEEEGKNRFWLCLAASAMLTLFVFWAAGNCFKPYLVLYAGMYLLLYLSMIWQSVKKEEMDVPQGAIAALAITILVLAGVAILMYLQKDYLFTRLDAWIHPEAWRHGSDYEAVRTLLQHSSIVGHYDYAPGMVGMVQYLQYYVSAIPIVVLYYGGWLPTIGFILLILLFAAAVALAYYQMHKAEVKYLPVYRMITMFWILRSVFGLLGLFTVLPLNLSLPFATPAFAVEDAALLGIFLYGLWGKHYADWKERVSRSLADKFDLDEEDTDYMNFVFGEFDEDDSDGADLDEVIEKMKTDDKPDKKDESDKNDQDQDDFDDDNGEWEELEEYGEV